MDMGRSLSGSVSHFSPQHGHVLVYAVTNYRLVIVLIAAEILVAAVNIVVDLYAGVD